VVTPVAVLAGGLAILLWGVPLGVAHAAFTMASGMLLVDVVLCGLRKVPFACTYFPGRSRAATHWPFYLLAFSTYAYGLTGTALASLSRPFLSGALLVGLAAASWFVRRLRRANLRPPPGLVFEEVDPDGMFDGYRLSESAAAQASARTTRSF
jgi:hypothetical protein